MTADGRVRVAIDVTAIPDRLTGVGRGIVDLVRELSTRTDDLELFLFARQHDNRRWLEWAPTVRLQAVAPERRPLRLLWEQTALPLLLRRLKIDVHHGPHYTMPEAARLPKAVTVHDLTFFDHPEWHERAKVPVFQRAVRVAARHADLLICVSHTTAERLDALLRPTAPVQVIPHGVDLDRFTADADETDDLRLLADAGVAPPYVAFVGTIEPRKNVPGLVRAFDRIAADHPDVRLVLAGGRGWGGDAVDEACATARSGDRIVRTGYLPEDALPALLRRAEVVAYPAFEEGFGLPVLEALACGATVVTTEGTSMADVAGGAAVLVPPGDDVALAGALDVALRGDPDREARRVAGITTAARFTWAAAADAHVAAYRSLANRH